VKTPHRLDESRIADVSQGGASDHAKEDVGSVHRCGTQDRERGRDCLTDHGTPSMVFCFRRRKAATIIM
jgi:hypothetical protein